MLDLLFETEGLPGVELPDELERLYGGSLGFETPRLYANFVSTIDGVVAISSVPESNKVIAAGSEADRFLMGLLRAFADVILIGSGTLHGSPKGLWAPEGPYPATADALAELRRELELPPVPEVAILTRSGSIEESHPVFEKGALVLTTRSGRAVLGSRLPAASAVVALGEDLDPGDAVACLRERGHARVLSEGGPNVFGSLVAAGLVDELFLTVSPLLAGRGEPDDRLQLIEDAPLLPDAGVGGRLLSARAHGSHLFLRYELVATPV
ncbi:MAG: dihydrofolate reductase family protein [Actinomycetota bacterium]|nr:dihydrofolate reductase family protein [Actinomycetota bacterium]